MKYNEYKQEVKRIFAEQMPALSAVLVDEYFATDEVEETIQEDYEMFSDEDNIAGVSPSSTASCLYMMY